MSAFDAVIGDKYWGCGETAGEALGEAFDLWCAEDDGWWEGITPTVEIYEGALFASSNNPDHDNGFVLVRWTRRGTVQIVSDESDQPVPSEIVWGAP